jgi:hypothetical protein
MQKGAIIMATGTNGEATKRRPIWSRKYWPVEAAVFEYLNKDGRLQHSVKLSKSFRRKEDSPWETTELLSTQDIPVAKELLSDAYRFIQARLQKDYESRKDSAVVNEVEVDAEAIPF